MEHKTTHWTHVLGEIYQLYKKVKECSTQKKLCQCSISIHPMTLWRFQGVKKWNIGLKRAKHLSYYMPHQAISWWLSSASFHYYASKKGVWCFHFYLRKEPLIESLLFIPRNKFDSREIVLCCAQRKKSSTTGKN